MTNEVFIKLNNNTICCMTQSFNRNCTGDREGNSILYSRFAAQGTREEKMSTSKLVATEIVQSIMERMSNGNKNSN